MIVFRETSTVKRGRKEEAVALQKERDPATPPMTGRRIYTAMIGPNIHNIVVEGDFESLAALEQWAAGTPAGPEDKAWRARWFEVIEGPTSVEFYNLE